MRRPLCYFAVVLIGVIFIYYQIFPASYPDCPENGSWEICQGTVCSKEYQKDKILVCLKDVNLQNDSNTSYKGVLFYMENDASNIPKLQARVVVKGSVSNFEIPNNPGEFDTKEYYRLYNLDFELKNVEIIKESKKYSKWKEALYIIRTKEADIYDYYLSDNDSAALKAIVLGNKKQMGSEQKKLYRLNGISHIMAISGMHISILGLGLYRLLKKLRLPNAVCMSLPVIVIFLYGEMVGLSSSAIRAILMLSLKILATYLGRRYDVYSAMAVAAITILFEQPLYIFNAGFILSFTAVLGVCLMPKIFQVHTKRKNIYDPLVINLSIFLMQLPATLYYFYEYPIISFLTNIIIIPLIPGLFILGIALIPQYLLKLSINLLPNIIHFLIYFIEKICGESMKVHGLVWVAGRPSKPGIIMYYALILGLIIHINMAGDKKSDLVYWKKVMLILLAILALNIKYRSPVELNYLYMGQGNATVISDNRGHNYIVDCGSVTKTKAGEYTLLPFLKYKGIGIVDGIFITHLDTDHYSALMELLDFQNEVRIKKVYLSKTLEGDETAKRLINQCFHKKIKIHYLEQGDTVKKANMCFKIFHPNAEQKYEDMNSNSLVIGFEYKDFQALFPGDIPSDVEEGLINYMTNKKIDVFLASHHGSKYSNSEQLLKRINPKITVISCGKNNSYGHPHKEALERIKEVNSKTYITYETGTVTISSNGRKQILHTFH